MKTSTSIAVLVGFLSFVHTGVAQAQVPEAYGRGRPEAVAGAYDTHLRSEGSVFELHQRVAHFENRSFGALTVSTQEPLQLSQDLFSLEIEGLKLLLEISGLSGQKGQFKPDHLTGFEREILSTKVSLGYQRVRTVQELLVKQMIREIDIVLPGPNGKQIKTETRSDYWAYAPNYRSDADLSEQQKVELYQKKVDEFLKKGGRLSEMFELRAEGLSDLPTLSRFEYVVRAEDRSLWVTPGEAGHILLAQGQQVRAAGQLVLLKGANNEILFVVFSNASGSYKPDLLSVRKEAEYIARNFGISPERVVYTEGEPIGPQTYKIWAKAKGLPSERVKAVVDRMINELRFSFPDLNQSVRPRALLCNSVWVSP